MKEKEKMFKEKIERLVEIIANKRGWGFYRILNLDVILDYYGKFVVANITINYQDKNGIHEQLMTRITKITQKNFIENAMIR